MQFYCFLGYLYKFQQKNEEKYIASFLNKIATFQKRNRQNVEKIANFAEKWPILTINSPLYFQ